MELRKLAREAHFGNLSFGTLERNAVQELISICPPPRDEFEMIAVSQASSGARPDLPATWLGFDSYADGFGSPLALGFFEKGERFPMFRGCINRHGLFGNQKDSEAYVRYYTGIAEAAGLEPVSLADDIRHFEIWRTSLL